MANRQVVALANDIRQRAQVVLLAGQPMTTGDGGCTVQPEADGTVTAYGFGIPGRRVISRDGHVDYAACLAFAARAMRQ